MSHTDIILITVTLFVTFTIGGYALVKYINIHTRPPVNSLRRTTGDIELQYIEPSTNNTSEVIPVRVPCTSEATYNTSEGITSSNHHSYNILDLSQPQQVYIPSYQNSSYIDFCSEDSMNLQRIPSYIFSCSEDSINLNYILLFIIFLFLVVLTIRIKRFKIG